MDLPPKQGPSNFKIFFLYTIMLEPENCILKLHQSQNWPNIIAKVTHTFSQ